MTDVDLFRLNNARDLYGVTLDTYTNYIQNPTERDFLFLVFAFTHLREWISGVGHKEIDEKKRLGMPLSAGEIFFLSIFELNEFKTVQALCNRGKHCIVGDVKNRTSKVSGLDVRFGTVNDSLDQTYFLIDDVDSRQIFIKLIQKYNSWFNEHG